MQSALLWSVDFGSSRSYLFGTMHSGHPIPTSFTSRLYEYMAASSCFAAEMDLDEVDPLAFAKAAKLPADSSLVTLLGITKFEKCRRAFSKFYGFDLLAYMGYHPFAVVSSLTQFLLDSDQDPLDQQLQMQAKEIGLPCHGLESFALQLATFQSIPVRAHIRTMIRIARNPSKFRSQLHQLLVYYRRQQVGPLYHASKRQLGDMRSLLLYHRNQAMTRVFTDLRDQYGDLFVAVGAAHLPGEKGMLRLLKQEGAHVKPIPLSPRDE